MPPPIADPGVPLLVTEGIRKADAAVSIGMCCLGLLGVWNWRGSNELGGKVSLPDWESVALNNRLVLICFDSDVILKASVHAAFTRLREFLKSRGATVKTIYLPAGTHGEKVGLDDFIATQLRAGKTNGEVVNLLVSMATDRLPSTPDEPANEGVVKVGRYRETREGLFRLKSGPDDTIEAIQIANFNARIVAEVCRDDGVERTNTFEIEASVNGEVRRAVVPAAQFAGMSWISDKLGARAVIGAGAGTRDQAREAIQLLSSAAVTARIEFAHSGWRKIDDCWAYLHAGGAIGRDGDLTGIETSLPDALAPFVLPQAPTGDQLKSAVRASLAVLDLAPARLTVVILGAVWRSVLGDSDFNLFIHGATGLFKSELAALAQQHFGAGFDAHHLPASWTSTANFNEVLAFAAKDGLLVVDDFKPGGSAADRQRMHRDAERLLRAAANRSGRGRLRSDASPRPSKSPRALLLSTGEERPLGESLGARIMFIEVEANDIDAHKLTACQRDAASGLYAQAMAGYLRWLAGKLDDVRKGYAITYAQHREHAARQSFHRRTPGMVADLFIGWEQFLTFTLEVGALTADEIDAYRARVWDALGEVAQRQVQHQERSQPHNRFLELLRSAIGSGAAHVATRAGDAPRNARGWGWRAREFNGNTDLLPQGARVGWIDEDASDLYLDADTAYRAAQSIQTDGDGIAVTVQTLTRRLHQAGLLKTTDLDRGKLRVRRMIEGVRRDMLHLDTEVLGSHAPEEIGPTGPDEVDHES